MTELVRLLVEWKTLLLHGLEVIRLDYFARLVFNSDFRTIKVSNDKVDACQGLYQSDFVFNQKISTLSLELFMWLLLHDNYDVTGLLTRILIGLSMESVLAVVWSTLVNAGIDNLLLFSHLLALACLAFVGVINDLTFTTAVVARTL